MVLAGRMVAEKYFWNPVGAAGSVCTEAWRKQPGKMKFDNQWIKPCHGLVVEVWPLSFLLVFLQYKRTSTISSVFLACFSHLFCLYNVSPMMPGSFSPDESRVPILSGLTRQSLLQEGAFPHGWLGVTFPRISELRLRSPAVCCHLSVYKC